MTLWPPGLVVVAAVTAPYLLWWARATRSGVGWPWWRGAVYVGLGVGTLVVCVLGPLQVDRARVLWVGALQAGVLGCVTPVALALGDPLRLRARARAARASATRNAAAIDALRRVARVLMFPAVSSILSIGSILLMFVTPYFAASTRSGAVEALLVVHLLGTGLLFVLPLLVGDLLPAWATPGVRAVIAFADGLLDAVPGVVLLTATRLFEPGLAAYGGLSPDDALTQQQLAGGALLAVAELVGIPVIAVVLVEWARADARSAREMDAALDSAALDPDPSTSEDSTPDPAAANGLWWESDPRFAGRRYRRPGEC